MTECVGNREACFDPAIDDFMSLTCNGNVCLQELSRLHQKIEKLEQLLSQNNRVVAKLRDSLLQRNTEAGANVSSNSAHSQDGRLPGCRAAEEMRDGTDGVQVKHSARSCLQLF